MELLLSIKPNSYYLSKSFSNQPLGMRCPRSRASSSKSLPRKHPFTRRVVKTHSVEPKQTVQIPIAGVTSVASIVFLLEDAYAADSVSNEMVQAASTTPQWLAPSVLAFPVVSYLLFNIYRDKVNPDAKVTDWMFGLAAMVIVANLVTIATLGVRLY